MLELTILTRKRAFDTLHRAINGGWFQDRLTEDLREPLMRSASFWIPYGKDREPCEFRLLEQLGHTGSNHILLSPIADRPDHIRLQTNVRQDQITSEADRRFSAGIE